MFIEDCPGEGSLRRYLHTGKAQTARKHPSILASAVNPVLNFLYLAIRHIRVSTGVILTHCTGVKVTHLGEDGSFLEAADVDPGASSGDTSYGPPRPAGLP
jgi:hypothetical protein